MRDRNMFDKAGEFGAKVVKAVYFDTVNYGYKKGRGKRK